MGSPKHNEEVKIYKKRRMLFGLVRSLTNNRSYQHLKISIGEIFCIRDYSDFFRGPNPPMPRLPHETVTFLVRLAETSNFLVEYVQSLRISDDLGLLTPPPLHPSQTIFRQIPVQSDLQSNWPPQRKGMGFKELNSRN